jgi:uncharacterized protein (TIGR02271 family)
MIDSGRHTIRAGDDVYGSDGDKLGTVIAVESDYVVIEKGWFFPTDYYIPVSAITSYEDGRAYLNVTKDAAINQGWEVEPVTTTSYETTAAATDTTIERDTDYVASDPTLTEDTLRVPVYAEELTATTVPRDVGGARIEKTVVAEEQVLEVPITEERLKVVRRTVDRPVDAVDAEQAFEEVIVDVPVRTEEVELGKRVRVGEEVEIQKEEVQRTEQVTGTVRREEVRVTEAEAGTLVDEERPR